MRFIEISVKGFEGIGHEPGIELTGLQNRNILIGPNNVGKSSFFRCMHLVHEIIENIPNEAQDRAATIFAYHVETSAWWNQDLSKDIWIYFAIQDPSLTKFATNSPIGMPIVQGDVARFDIFITHVEGKSVVALSPRIYTNSSLPPRPLLLKNSNGTFSCITSSGTYGQDKQPRTLLANDIAEVLRLTLNTRFFDSVRTILKPSAETGDMIDGSDLLPKFYKMWHDTSQMNQYKRLKAEVLAMFNRFVHLSGFLPFDDFDVMGSETAPELTFEQQQRGLHATRMGSGILELFFICSSLILDKNADMQYFLEEPENHMHPALLRRLFQMFKEYKNVQFFINTHSHVLLDDIADGDSVYLWSRNPTTQESSAMACRKLIDYHQVLDDIGIRASSLMQTNCVIWVEGPSDRTYMKQWLDELGESKNDKVIDGSDYMIVTYGGALLANFELEATDDEFISMVRLSRFAVVLMDRDLPLKAPETELKPRVQNILTGLEADKRRRRAILTIGREIENDIEETVLYAALEKRLAWLKPAPGAVRKATITSDRNYFDEVPEAVFADEVVREKAVDCLKNKVLLAKAVIKSCVKGSPSYPDYAVEIYNHILKSRLEGLAPQTEEPQAESV
ncbi:MAG: ATP-binding protein [Cyanobacteria bacterium SZAS-4]|nr:ATP-binding protein [Cyanobacteria bacterium SZAS-4]